MRFAPLFLLASLGGPAFAAGPTPTSCDATRLFTLNWDALTPKGSQLASGTFWDVTNGAGQTVRVTMTLSGDTTHYVNVGYGLTPNISVQHTGGIGATENTLFLATSFAAYDTDVGTNANTAVVTFSFTTTAGAAVRVREVNFKLMDIDYSAGQYRDWVRVSAADGATYVPVLTAPYPTAGTQRNNVTNPGVTAPGITYVGPGTSGTYTFVNGDLSGTAVAALNADTGNIDAYVAEPVTSATVRYGNGPASTMTGTAGQQAISVHDISFCPMPVLAVSKTSTPFSDPVNGTINPKLIPGGDVSYAITLTNNGGSTLDLNGLLADDVLPASVTFFNGNYDGSTVGPFNFSVAGGAVITTGSVVYSSTGAAPFTYTPAAGYDPNVKALRLSGTGSVPPGGSMTVRFRTQIK